MKRPAILLLAEILFLLMGCGMGKSDSLPRPIPAEADVSPAMQAEARPPETISGASENSMKDETGTMSEELTLMLGDVVIPVIWEDNAAVAELTAYAAEAQIDIAMQMYGGWEQVGSLGRSISRDDTQLKAVSGDIMLYSGNQIVLFYGTNSWAYTKLGHMDLSDAELTELLGRQDVVITLTVH